MDFTDACDCGGTFRYSIDDVAAQRTVKCSRGCGSTLTLQDGGGAATAAKSLRDLDKALDNFGRRR